MTQNKHRQKAIKAEVSRAVTHTYILFESSSAELQADQSGRVKTSRLSKNSTSYLITWSQLLEGFGFEGPRLSHPIQWKTIQGVGNKVSAADLEEPAFPPGERVLEGC